MYICTKFISIVFLNETGFAHILNQLQRYIANIGVAENNGDS